MLSKLGTKLLALLRIALGWLYFYAGITKVLSSTWTAAGYANSAKTFSGLYTWFASPGNIGWINFVNKWGLTLLGISLIIGIGVRLSSSLGAVLMLSYYLPILDFPVVGDHSYIVDEHIIYILVLLFFAAVRAGRYFGLESWFERTVLKKFTRFQRIFG